MIVVSLDLVEPQIDVVDGFWSGTFVETPAVGALITIKCNRPSLENTIPGTDIPVPGTYKVLLHSWTVAEHQFGPMQNPHGIVTLVVRRAKDDEMPW